MEVTPFTVDDTVYGVVTAPPTAPTPPPISAPVAGLPPVTAATPAPAPAPSSPPVTARVPGSPPQPASIASMPPRAIPNAILRVIGSSFPTAEDREGCQLGGRKSGGLNTAI